MNKNERDSIVHELEKIRDMRPIMLAPEEEDTIRAMAVIIWLAVGIVIGIGIAAFLCVESGVL